MGINYLSKISNRVKSIYWNNFRSNESYARHLGVKIGEHSMIATRHWPTEAYLITIGNNVQVTQDVYFHTHGGAHVAREKYPNFDVFGKVYIGDNVYIGSASHIMPGVRIGNSSLIAAGSIVCKSVPAGEVWGGIPAKFICTVEEYITKNEQYNLNSKNLSDKDKKGLLLSLPENKFLRK